MFAAPASCVTEILAIPIVRGRNWFLPQKPNANCVHVKGDLSHQFHCSLKWFHLWFVNRFLLITSIQAISVCSHCASNCRCKTRNNFTHVLLAFFLSRLSEALQRFSQFVTARFISQFQQRQGKKESHFIMLFWRRAPAEEGKLMFATCSFDVVVRHTVSQIRVEAPSCLTSSSSRLTISQIN